MTLTHFILEINITSLKEKEKGKFFNSIMPLVTKEEFEPFRTSVKNIKEVFLAKEKDYESLLRMSKIINELNRYKGYFVLYKENGLQKEIVRHEDLLIEISNFKEKHNLPHFKYNPNAYEISLISFYNDNCEVCGKQSDFFGSSSPYGEEDIDSVCVHCINSGKAHKKFECEFNIIKYNSIKEQDKINELVYQTPGIFSWQEFDWLEHCDDFCAYLGKVKWKDIQHLEEEMKEELELHTKEYSNSTVEDLIEALNRYMDGHLFQCLHCGKYKLKLDLM